MCNVQLGCAARCSAVNENKTIHVKLSTTNCSATLKPTAIVGEKACFNVDWQTGTPSIYGGYSAADTFLDDRIDAIRQRTYLPSVSVLRHRTVYELLTSKVYRSSGTPKSVFGGGKRFTSIRILVFLPSFVEIHKAELTKPLRGVYHEKRLVFGPFPFLWGPWSDIARNFTGSPFSHFPSRCQVSSKSVQFPRR